MNHEETKSYQKEKLLKDKPLAYSIMCYTETKNVLNLKQYYAFYATALFEEYDRLRTQNGDKFKKQMLIFVEKHLKLLSSNLLLLFHMKRSKD